MATATEITVKVEVKPDITEESALRCLKIVEWYMNEHNDLQIIGETDSCGYERYTIRKKPWLEGGTDDEAR